MLVNRWKVAKRWRITCSVTINHRWKCNDLPVHFDEDWWKTVAFLTNMKQELCWGSDTLRLDDKIIRLSNFTGLIESVQVRHGGRVKVAKVPHSLSIRRERWFQGHDIVFNQIFVHNRWIGGWSWAHVWDNESNMKPMKLEMVTKAIRNEHLLTASLRSSRPFSHWISVGAFTGDRCCQKKKEKQSSHSGETEVGRKLVSCATFFTHQKPFTELITVRHRPILTSVNHWAVYSFPFRLGPFTWHLPRSWDLTSPVESQLVLISLAGWRFEFFFVWFGFVNGPKGPADLFECGLDSACGSRSTDQIPHWKCWKNGNVWLMSPSAALATYLSCSSVNIDAIISVILGVLSVAILLAFWWHRGVSWTFQCHVRIVPKIGRHVTPIALIIDRRPPRFNVVLLNPHFWQNGAKNWPRHHIDWAGYRWFVLALCWLINIKRPKSMNQSTKCQNKPKWISWFINI